MQYLIVIMVFVLLIGMLLLPRYLESRTKYRFSRQNSLLTANELRFYKVLNEALKNTDLYICPKVRILDLIKVNEKGSNYWRARNSVIQKHVDFLITNRNSMEIVYIVELDDSSHLLESRRKSDSLKNEVIQAIGIPLMRFPSSKTYFVEDFKQIFLSPTL